MMSHWTLCFGLWLGNPTPPLIVLNSNNQPHCILQQRTCYSLWKNKRSNIEDDPPTTGMFLSFLAALFPGILMPGLITIWIYHKETVTSQTPASCPVCTVALRMTLADDNFTVRKNFRSLVLGQKSRSKYFPIASISGWLFDWIHQLGVWYSV